MKQHTPIKVGKSGSKVHAGYIIGTMKKGFNIVNVYSPECTVVNTHNVNRHPQVFVLPAGTAITCENCQRIVTAA